MSFRAPAFRACLLAAAVLGAVLVPLASASTAPAEAPAATGLPYGVPPAALKPEPVLPTPAAWPFPDAFPRTSGTGRLVGGAFEWADFLYDDHGAAGVPHDRPVAGLAPAFGSYTYAAEKARGNGADVFRTAVGVDAEASYWRVDWNTLVDPALPVAQWTVAAPGATSRAWPGGSGVSSPWSSSVLVSSKGAYVFGSNGVATRVGQVSVDTAARSFVARIPLADLPLTGTSSLRMVAGLANAVGNGFAPLSFMQTGYQGAPNVYNIGIRPESAEPVANALWRESAQAQALALGGDVSAFSATVDWSRLRAGETTPEPVVKGKPSNRWFVSSWEDPRQGVVPDGGFREQDLRPNFLGRVQPYTAFVPTSYSPDKATPLTWLLHSLGVQHNQYAALNPKLLKQACEDRGAICVTTLGRGPDGWYLDEAELDFWEVWNRTAAAFTLDPERTVLSGYSMGGYGTYRLGLTYPDLFAKAVALAAPPMCGVRVSGPIQGASGAGRCTTDGDSSPLVGNARSLPYVIAHGALDQLVPVPSAKEQADRFDSAGLRHRFELYPEWDHLAWAVADAFSSPASRMTGTRETDPGRISYTWFPNAGNAALGTGTTGAYWVRDLSARTATAGARASFEAVSAARPEGAVTTARTTEPIANADPAVGVATELVWQRGAAPERSPAVTLRATNVKGLSVDVVRAGLLPDETATVTVAATDGPLALSLARVAPGTSVLRDGSPVATVGSSGTVLLDAVTTGTVVTLVPGGQAVLALDLPASVRTTDGLPVAARLTEGDDPVAGRVVTFAAGGATTTAETGADGTARAVLPVTADPGPLAVVASTDGAADAAGTVQVLAELTRLTWTGDTRGRGDAVTARAVLTEDDGPALAGRTVVFRAGDSSVTAVTDAAGVATASVPVPDHGRSRVVTADYVGETRFVAAATSATVTWGG